MRKQTSKTAPKKKQISDFDDWRMQSVEYMVELMALARGEGAELDAEDLITMCTMLVSGFVLLHEEIADVKKLLQEAM